MTVTTAQGTSNTLSFDYMTPPTVTAVSPNSGPASGGTSVLVSGTNLAGVTAVDFGGVPAASFHYNGIPILGGPPPGTITAVSPPGDLSIVDVQVISGGGESLASPPHFTYVPRPAILSVGTATVGIAGTASLTISGSGLGNATSVAFGNLQATILSDSDTQIVAEAHRQPVDGPVDVTVTTAGGTSDTSEDDQVDFRGGPAVKAITPVSGSSSGSDLVTIYGTNLDDATAVYFGQNAGTIVDQSADYIDVYSPPGDPGAAGVSVVTPSGTSDPKQLQFDYVRPCRSSMA